MKLADLIRSMTDEELAGNAAFVKWLQSFQVSDLLYRVERRIQEGER